MYIAEILPFTKNLYKEHLSYFTAKEVAPGALVYIDVRKKTVPGIVLKCESATENKSDVRSKDFALKKIRKISPTSPLQQEFCTVAQEAADYFATFPSNIVNMCIPRSLVHELDSLPPTKPRKQPHTAHSSLEKYVIQDTLAERESHYKTIIRNAFVHHESVMIICPTIEDVSQLSRKLSRGISEQTFVFHSRLSAKKMKETWRDAIKHEKPIVIICTPTFVSIPRHDLGAFIIEKESSSAYTTRKQPIVDVTHVIEMLAQKMSVRLYRGDMLLRLKTIHELHNDRYNEYSPARFRFLSSATSEIIPMKGLASTVTKQDKVEFAVLSDSVIRRIEATHHDNQHMFIFSARTGLASSIVCGDCGTLVTCSWCSSPMILHGNDATDAGNVFRCHSCGEERSAGELCKHCNSWKLKTLGIGTERVYKSVCEHIPKENVFLMDSEHITTPRQARAYVQEFLERPGSVLVGTEMVLLYLRDAIEHVAIASIDPLFAIPNFTMRERIMRTLLQLRDRAQESFTIQTRKKDEGLFDLALRGNSAEFIRNELADRKKFNYPPFSVIIKMTYAGDKKSVEQTFEDLVEFFKPYELMCFPSFHESSRRAFVMNGIIRLGVRDWIDQELLEKLRSLPPDIRIIVDAQSLV